MIYFVLVRYGDGLCFIDELLKIPDEFYVTD